jgi:hypothetical protein
LIGQDTQIAVDGKGKMGGECWVFAESEPASPVLILLVTDLGRCHVWRLAVALRRMQWRRGAIELVGSAGGCDCDTKEARWR